MGRVSLKARISQRAISIWSNSLLVWIRIDVLNLEELISFVVWMNDAMSFPASDPPSTAKPLASSSTQLSQDSISALEYITQQEELGTSFFKQIPTLINRIFSTRYPSILFSTMYRSIRSPPSSRIRMYNMFTNST